MEKPIKNITPAEFKTYGYVIEHDYKKDNFQVVLTESDELGWRIAVSKITSKSVSRFGRHPNSMESFEPMEGTTCICVAGVETPEDYEIFLLDKPVCLFKNVWHAVFCLSEFSYIKITENAVVDSKEHILDESIRIIAVG